MPLRELRYKVKRYARRVTERFVFMPDQVREGRREIRRFNKELMVIGAESLRYDPRVLELVGFRNIEGDGERLYRLCDHLAHDGSDS